ncbi:MAG: alpha/beta hydrolase [Candidatus Heimdallarchaeota archaeon]
MKKELLWKIFLVFGILLCIYPIGMQIQIDYTLRNNQTITFIDSAGYKIFNKYYPASEPSPIVGGVMLFHGFGEDQTSMDNLILRFQGDFHVFATDFSGHGRSNGLIDSDLLSEHIHTAKEQFKSASDLNNSQIILIGHSRGASAVLRYTVDAVNPVKGCILLGGATDPVENPLNLTTDNPPTNVHIVTGTWEDILLPSEAIAVYNILGNTTGSGLQGGITTPEGYRREFRIFKALMHTYEVISPRVAQYTLNATLRMLNSYQPDTNLESAVIRPIDMRAWILPMEIVGFILTLVFAILLAEKAPTAIVKQEKSEEEDEEKIEEENQIGIINPKLFFGLKFPIMLPGLAIGALIAFLICLLPMGIPFFTLLFLFPVVGYGIIMLIFYATGKMPGAEGKFKPRVADFKKDLNGYKILFTAIIGIIIIALFSYFISSTVYHIFPLNIRLFWLALFTILSVIGFFMLQVETELIQKSFPNKINALVLNNTLFLSPFIIGVIYLLAAGNLIYFLDGLHDMIILVLVILSGGLLQRLWKKKLLTAIFQAFLLFFLVVPRGPLTWYF